MQILLPIYAISNIVDPSWGTRDQVSYLSHPDLKKGKNLILIYYLKNTDFALIPFLWVYDGIENSALVDDWIADFISGNALLCVGFSKVWLQLWNIQHNTNFCYLWNGNIQRRYKMFTLLHIILSEWVEVSPCFMFQQAKKKVSQIS